MDDWVDVGAEHRFREQRGRVVEVAGHKVAVFRARGRWIAVQDECPHMGASLAGGRIKGDKLVCHWHGWGFDLETGVSDVRDWACAALYPIRVEDGRVLVQPVDRPEPRSPEEADDDAGDDDPLIRFDPNQHLKPRS